jgi:putative ABC transport system permease protein
MNLVTENIRIAFRALTANKMRSVLTMLGIIIGVAAVVALLSIGQGATASITSQVEGLGSNLVSVFPGRLFNRGEGGSENARLFYSDYQAIAANGVNMSQIAPIYQTLATIKYNDKNTQLSVAGVTPEYAAVRAYTLANGRFINRADNNQNAQVVVLGSQTASDLFGNLNPVGQRLRINGIAFEVVGVLESKSSGTGFGSQDDLALVPLETAYTKLFGSLAEEDGKRLVSSIFISAANPDVVDDVIAQINFLLRKAHGLAPGTENDFTAVSQSEFLSTLNTITTTLTIFLAAIAAISLLVGGIGIMNIMLVSVTERTREIGLRKAVGAKRSTILFQFLVETVTLSVVGGLIGILLGAGIAYTFTSLDLITAELTMNTIALAFFFATIVGVFFGIYPAMRASRLRPIEALRYE